MLRKNNTQVNAGSTADIAFLLLIFFLVTTTINTDKGIHRKLPQKNSINKKISVLEENLFSILINSNGELLVNNEPLHMSELKHNLIAFIDNGSGVGKDACIYCKGKKLNTLSRNPQDAVISLQTDRGTSYQDYVGVQNEITAAYNFLRNRESERLYGVSYEQLRAAYHEMADNDVNKIKLKQQLNHVIELYPQHITEPLPKT